MHARKSSNKNLANHRLYQALMEALIEDENVIDKGVADTVKDHKRKHDDDKDDDDDDEDPPAGPNHGKKTKRGRTKDSESSKKPSTTNEAPKGKALSKGSKTSKSVSAKEPVEEPIAEDPLIINNLIANPIDISKGTYTTSITKTKSARYEIKGIKDMVLTLWSTINHAYDKDAEKGIKHWSERRKLCVKKLYGYDHLEEIMVKRSYQRLYKLKEGDFVDLHLNDLEDILFLVVQHKLFHLDKSGIVDFIVALRMLTRILILKRHVEDLQLGVDSYQKKLNITKPQKTFPGIELKEPYTPSYDPPGIVYEDLNKQNRVLRADELYKFSDGTLMSVRDEMHHIVLKFRLDYNTEMPTRKWTAVDQRRSGLMIELIDKQLREREIVKNLKRLVGARELEMD
uniref:Uncharacterized protein n=1 Tax=Tanacetum cinerariifolium TaxID=118510 RepID=A0A6L2MT89_TANCI|nr:hypothetical protein [Tanacetum cinerariifolium]